MEPSLFPDRFRLSHKLSNGAENRLDLSIVIPQVPLLFLKFTSPLYQSILPISLRTSGRMTFINSEGVTILNK